MTMKTLIAALFLLFAIHATAAEFAYQGNKVDTVIDVRTPEEFASGHIEGAINIPYDTITPNLPALARIGKDENIVLYCRSGRRSGIAMQTLASQGYRNLRNGGGLDALASRIKVCKDASC